MCTKKKRNCEYDAEEGVTSQAINKRRLEGYAVVLQLLRDAGPKDCKLILQDLKRLRNLAEAVDTVQETWMPKDASKEQMTTLWPTHFESGFDHRFGCEPIARSTGIENESHMPSFIDPDVTQNNSPRRSPSCVKYYASMKNFRGLAVRAYKYTH
ncbi:hypothetical protein D6D08_03771 [Aureobasidium pullulans]|nr:hypothetical protein D6D08_03771 [Aureobasidium pullulans]